MTDEGLRQGALGVSSLTGYAPEGITTYELFAVQRSAAQYGRVYSSHQRVHGNSGHPESALGFDEMFSNAMALDAPLMVSHNNDWGWWEIEEKLQEARARGHNMWSEYYPYAAISTNAGAQYLQPPVWEDIMQHEYEGNFYDPMADKQLSRDEFLQMVQDDPGHTLVVTNPARVPWLPYWLRMPHMTVASDAMWMDTGKDVDFPVEQYEGHPRTAGSRGMVLRLAREQGVPLMFTVSQLSYWSAKHLGDTGLEAMQERGRMQEGMVADITIFDPETAREGSTYKTGEQGLPSEGIPYVIVNGTMVVKDSEFQMNTRSGQPLRFPVEENGRFDGLSAEKWVKDFSIIIPTIGDQGALSDSARARFRRDGGSN
jgi:N-acyl-D-aspartate/D-glutamate deacylase